MTKRIVLHTTIHIMSHSFGVITELPISKFDQRILSVSTMAMTSGSIGLLVGWITQETHIFL